MQHISDMFGVRQTDDRTTPKSTRWNIYHAALYYAWGPAGARASKPEWPNLVPIFYGYHDLSTLLLGKVPTKRSERVDTVEPTSSESSGTSFLASSEE